MERLLQLPPVRGLFDWAHASWLLVPIVLAEAVLCALIVLRVPYTKIDWDAYMQEVAGPMRDNEWDYSALRGETGPLVYPAGFVYLYGALRLLGGGDGSDVRTVQWAFGAVYVLTQALVVTTYAHAAPKHLPPWALLLLCVSKRLHSLYVLRLFNDCWAMLLLYAAVALFTRNRWTAGCVLYSLAVSVKVNILLFAPGLLYLLLEAGGIHGAVGHIALCALVQLALGAPFLYTNPLAYIGGSLRGFGDLNQKWWRKGGSFRLINPEQTLTVLLSANFAGVVFSRSLHFQFYCWYYHALPLLLWRAPRLPLPLKLSIFVLLEYAWSYGLDRSTGSSTPQSALALQLAHVLTVFAVWVAPPVPTTSAPITDGRALPKSD